MPAISRNCFPSAEPPAEKSAAHGSGPFGRGSAGGGEPCRSASGLGRAGSELEGRQSWTVNAARLAIAAPWVTLALLSTRPQALDAYRTSAGAVILIVAALASLLAYRVMLWIGRLPEEERVIAA